MPESITCAVIVHFGHATSSFFALLVVSTTSTEGAEEGVLQMERTALLELVERGYTHNVSHDPLHQRTNRGHLSCELIAECVREIKMFVNQSTTPNNESIRRRFAKWQMISLAIKIFTSCAAGKSLLFPQGSDWDQKGFRWISVLLDSQCLTFVCGDKLWVSICLDLRSSDLPYYLKIFPLKSDSPVWLNQKQRWGWIEFN